MNARVSARGVSVQTRSAPVCGIVARTDRGRARLVAGLRRTIPSTFPRPPLRWWFDAEAGIALYGAEPRPGAGDCLLTLTGSLYREAGIEDFNTPENPGSRSLLDELRRRDVAALAGLRGEFALAFWDGARRRLLLARDSLGQRNLFIRTDDDFHVWSSELRTLLDDRSWSCELDFESAFHYLACGLPPPGHTMARGIRCIPAAHLMWWEPGRPLLTQRYWTPLHDEASKTGGQATEAAISNALDQAVTVRLEASSSQALLLSGGLDSSFIAATAAAKLGGDRIQAYTIEFAPGYGKNETPYARLAADVCKIRHHVVPLRPREARVLLEETLEAAEPCSAWATITHRHLLRRIREDGHEHLLSGLGSDEVFAGYQRLLEYYFRSRRHSEGWPVQGAVDAFDGLLWDSVKGRHTLYPGVAQFFAPSELRASLMAPYQRWEYTTHLEEFYRECRRIKPQAHPFEMMIAHECQRRIPDLLFVDFEAVGREFGVRTAYPFLDAKLVELVCGLGASSRFKYESRRWSNKLTFRNIAAARLPATIVSRLPTSYSAPFGEWMQEPTFARPFVARLQRSRFWKIGLLRPEVLKRLLRSISRDSVSDAAKPQQPAAWVRQSWALLTLVSWYDHFVERTT